MSTTLSTEASREGNQSQVVGVLPEGWKLVRVNEHFDALIEALERAEEKGYLPDAVRESWDNFACDENVAAPVAPAAVAPSDARILGEFEKRAIGLALRDDCGTPTLDGVRILEGVRALLAAPTPTVVADAAPKLAVWYGAMPESNGKSNFTAILHNGDISSGITLDRSEYPDRVRYEADRARWLIGELAEEPFILEYDADKHSGYVNPADPTPSTDTPEELPGAGQDWGNIGPDVAFHLIERHAENWAHAGQLMEAWRSAVNARDAAAAQLDERK
ncbi:hypothetical protein AB4Y45_32720 [Paraburkholderia sp. EG287A]|uniref:hypothetical protein n=1 Tax=Paraburkholderia sp. EG287A TaxID=3237012 RepID=UPI0034D35AA4